MRNVGAAQDTPAGRERDPDLEGETQEANGQVPGTSTASSSVAAATEDQLLDRLVDRLRGLGWGTEIKKHLADHRLPLLLL